MIKITTIEIMIRKQATHKLHMFICKFAVVHEPANVKYRLQTETKTEDNEARFPLSGKDSAPARQFHATRLDYFRFLPSSEENSRINS